MLLSQESQYLDYNKKLFMFWATNYAKGPLHRDVLTVPDIKDIIDEFDSNISLTQDTEDLVIYVLQSSYLPTMLSLQPLVILLSGQLL